VKTFTKKELKLIEKLKKAPTQTTLDQREPCPNHSACMPLPVFRVYRVSEDEFAAEWNTHHDKGPKQLFLFADVSA
jgi:hypothetical protein